MAKPMSFHAKYLRGYVRHEKDSYLLDCIDQYGSGSKISHATDYSQRTLERHFASLKAHAVKHGYNQFAPDNSNITDLPIIGKSSFRKYNPPLPDGTTHEWVKTNSKEALTAQLLYHLLDGINGRALKPIKWKTPKTKLTNKLAMLTIADAHIGLLASKSETGHDWNTDKAIAALRFTIDYLVEKMDYVKEALLVNLGDLTHTDGLVAKTERSNNPLDADLRYFDICEAAGDLMAYAIDRLLTKAKHVRVFWIRGNHDDKTAYHLCEKFQAIYAAEPRVTVMKNTEYTQAYMWEKNLIVMTHGDAAKDERLYAYITTKWKKEYGQSEYCFVMKGHTHHKDSDSIGDMVFETFSTLTRSDAYHEFKMYKARRMMNIIVLDPEGGEDSRIVRSPKPTDEQYMAQAA